MSVNLHFDILTFLKVMVLVPLTQRSHFLESPLRYRQVNADVWIQQSIQYVLDHPASRFAKDDLRQLCYSIIRKPKSSAQGKFRAFLDYGRKKNLFHPPGASLPIKASAVLKDRPLFDKAIKAVDAAPLDIFLSLGAAIYALDITLSHPA